MIAAVILISSSSTTSTLETSTIADSPEYLAKLENRHKSILAYSMSLLTQQIRNENNPLPDTTCHTLKWVEGCKTPSCKRTHIRKKVEHLSGHQENCKAPEKWGPSKKVFCHEHKPKSNDKEIKRREKLVEKSETKSSACSEVITTSELVPPSELVRNSKKYREDSTREFNSDQSE